MTSCIIMFPRCYFFSLLFKTEAILTINAKTSHILVANQTACRLFGYKEEDLCGGMKIYDLFTMEDGGKQEILIERNVDTNGNIVMASGKIVSLK